MRGMSHPYAAARFTKPPRGGHSFHCLGTLTAALFTSPDGTLGTGSRAYLLVLWKKKMETNRL